MAVLWTEDRLKTVPVVRTCDLRRPLWSTALAEPNSTRSLTFQTVRLGLRACPARLLAGLAVPCRTPVLSAVLPLCHRLGRTGSCAVCSVLATIPEAAGRYRNGTRYFSDNLCAALHVMQFVRTEVKGIVACPRQLQQFRFNKRQRSETERNFLLCSCRL